MNRVLTHSLAAAALLALSGCNPADTAPHVDDGTPTPAPTPVYSNETYAKALKTASYRLRGLPPSVDETQAVLAGGQTAYEGYIDAWLTPGTPESQRLANSVREFYRTMFMMGQNIGGVDYDLVPNLATYIALYDKPVTELLTAEYCVGATGNPITLSEVPCVDGAPAGQRAGVISNKAFLKKFGEDATVNMRRVSVVHQLFACGIYPDPAENPPPLARTNMPEAAWPINNSGTPDDPSDDFPDPGEGDPADDPSGPNPRLHKKYQSKLPSAAGARCVDCHGQLNARRPVFTYYDQEGVYNPARSIGMSTVANDNVEKPSVNGDNDYCGVITGTPNDNMDSSDPALHPHDCSAINPPASYLGSPMSTLKDFGALILQTDRFYTCMTTRHYNFILGKSQGELSMQAAGGSGPPAMAPSTLEKYRTVYEASNWNSRELFRTILKSSEFLASQGAPINP